MKTKNFKKPIALFLAVMLCASLLFSLGTTAFAAEETANVCLIAFPRDGDANYNGEWGHGNLNFMNGWSTKASSFTLIRAMGQYSGNICYGKVHIIAAIRNEIIFAMDRFIQTNELNKITDGFSVPIRWTYSNTNSYNHPIIQILMKRISVASHDPSPRFHQWFPEKVNNKDTVNYILDNGWNKPRDIVRLLIAAQHDSLHCNDTAFTQAAFDSLRKEYSKNSLTEIRQELQSLYSSEEIEMVVRLLRGGPRFTTAEEIRKQTIKGSRVRAFWDERQDDILEDFYRVGFWGNVNRSNAQYLWRWNHKGDTDVLYGNGWELAIHPALCSELSIYL